MCNFIMVSCWYELYLVPFARYSASKISVSDLDLSGSPKVKYFNFFWKPTWDFIMFCWYELSISYRLRDIPHLRIQLVTLTFQGHRRSNISHFWEANVQLYNGILLTRTLYRVPFARYSASKISVSGLNLSASPKVKYFNFFWKPTWDFIMILCWYELSISYCLRDIPHLRFRLVTLTFQGHQRSNISHFWEANVQLHNGILLTRTLNRVPFARYSAFKISVSDLDLSGSPKVKYFNLFRKPFRAFIMMFCWYKLSISYRLRDIPHLRFWLVTLTFHCHQR